MKKGTSIVIIIIVIIAILYYFFFYYPSVKSPIVTVYDTCQVKNLGESTTSGYYDVELYVTLTIRNPNNFPIYVDNLRASLYDVENGAIGTLLDHTSKIISELSPNYEGTVVFTFHFRADKQGITDIQNGKIRFYVTGSLMYTAKTIKGTHTNEVPFEGYTSVF